MCRKIKENKKPKKNINEKKKPLEKNSNGIIFDFSCPTAFYSCNIKNQFTNLLKNPKEFVDIRRTIFGEALPHFNKTNINELERDKKNTHTHVISDSKIGLVEKILTELFRIVYNSKEIDKIVNNYISGDIWQIGYKKGLRFIGVRNDNIFNVLFIDYHHLLEPDKNYNQPDYYKYKYCPMTSGYCNECIKTAKN